MLLGKVAFFGFMARSTNGFDDVLVLGTWVTLCAVKSSVGIDQSQSVAARHRASRLGSAMAQIYYNNHDVTAQQILNGAVTSPQSKLLIDILPPPPQQTR